MHFAWKRHNFTETLLIQLSCDCPIGALLCRLLPQNLQVLAQNSVEDFPRTLGEQTGVWTMGRRISQCLVCLNVGKAGRYLCWQLVQGSGVPSAQHGTGTGAAGFARLAGAGQDSGAGSAFLRFGRAGQEVWLLPSQLSSRCVHGWVCVTLLTHWSHRWAVLAQNSPLSLTAGGMTRAALTCMVWIRTQPDPDPELSASLVLLSGVFVWKAVELQKHWKDKYSAPVFTKWV